MLVPNAEKAFVPPEKLSAYLLNVSHPVGSSKAQFFRAHGFGDHTADLLAERLLAVVTGTASTVRESPFGTKYVVLGDVPTPRGTVVHVETVWIIEPHDDRPRFVTAYPASGNRP